MSMNFLILFCCTDGDIVLQQKSKRKKDKESGVSRGIDFQHVANVINFDFPLDVTSYVHRAGRTARGHNQVGHFLKQITIYILYRLLLLFLNIIANMAGRSLDGK